MLRGFMENNAETKKKPGSRRRQAKQVPDSSMGENRTRWNQRQTDLYGDTELDETSATPRLMWHRAQWNKCQTELDGGT